MFKLTFVFILHELRSKREIYPPYRNYYIEAVGFEILHGAKNWVNMTYYFDTLL